MNKKEMERELHLKVTTMRRIVTDFGDIDIAAVNEPELAVAVFKAVQPLLKKKLRDKFASIVPPEQMDIEDKILEEKTVSPKSKK